eukprot:6181049-Pleurochrysis_carterae.AAC.4
MAPTDRQRPCPSYCESDSYARQVYDALTGLRQGPVRQYNARLTSMPVRATRDVAVQASVAGWFVSALINLRSLATLNVGCDEERCAHCSE